MAENEDTCRVVEIDGEPVRVRGAGEMTEEDTLPLGTELGVRGQDRGFFAEVVAAARRRFEAESAGGVADPSGT